MNYTQLYKREIENTFNADVANIIATYMPTHERYIAVKGHICALDKFNKAHLFIDADQATIIKQHVQNILLDAGTDTIKFPWNKANHDRIILKLGFPSFINHAKLQVKDVFKLQKEYTLMLRIGTYKGSKFGSGYYFHIMTDRFTEKTHSYKEQIPKIPYNDARFVVKYDINHKPPIVKEDSTEAMVLRYLRMDL